MVLPHRLALVAIVVALSGCGGVREQFLGSRVLDACNGEWPVCDTKVGCVLGDRSYVEGRFPGDNMAMIQLFEPSQVTVSFLLSEVGGAGTTTVINFYEDRCRSRIRTEIAGKTFIGESEQQGYVHREADLSGTGDHLIAWESDARTKYALKIDVLPLRLRDVGAGSP